MWLGILLTKLVLSTFVIKVSSRDDLRRASAWAYLLVLVTQVALMPAPNSLKKDWFLLCLILDFSLLLLWIFASPKCQLRTWMVCGLSWCVVVNYATFETYISKVDFFYDWYEYLIAFGASMELAALVLGSTKENLHDTTAEGA